MRVALDTNVLAYAEGVNGESRRAATIELLERLSTPDVLIPVQALGELYNVLVKRAGRSRPSARKAVLGWRDPYRVIATSSEVMLAALDLAADHHLGIWDSIMVAAASAGRCRLLLSEDLQSGFSWGGVTVVNPYADDLNPLLVQALDRPV